MSKALFFDIDGTLVPFNTHGVPPSTQEALHQAREGGHKVFICTGRPKQFIDNLEGVEYDGMICVTGALCLDREQQIINSRSIPQADVAALVEHLKQAGSHATPFLVVTPTKLFANNMNHPDVRFVMEMLHVQLPHIATIEELGNEEVLQLIGFFTHEEEPQIMGTLLPHCEAMRWYPTFADVVAKGVSKSYGIDRVLEHHHIALADTIAFGDGGNDISMLEHAATGVAMGNASPEVQSHADYVTDTAENDGIRKALLHFGLID